MNFHIIIPARFASTRLPGKPLLEIEGKPMIQQVFERAKLCDAASITIATDDEQILAKAKSFGAGVCMTSKHHPTGSDRLAEAVQILGLQENDIVVNIQGDEPLMPVSAVLTVVEAMNQNPTASITTLATKIHTSEDLFDPNVVKVIFDAQGFALYFSRAAIPFNRDILREDYSKLDFASSPYYRHLGLYAYRVSTLKKFARLPTAAIEEFERLEQLRLLWQGEKIHISPVVDAIPPGIDTEADLARVREYFRASATVSS